MVRFTNNIDDNQSGQAAAEYSLVLSFVFVAVVLTVALLGDSIIALFNLFVEMWP